MQNNWEFDENDRHILVISGESEACKNLAALLTKKLDTINLENPKSANQYLGQECDAVVFHTNPTFDANAFGAIAGTIRNGGYLFFLTPPHFSQESLFLKRFSHLLNNQSNARFIKADTHPDKIAALKKPSNQLDKNNLYATQDQQNAVNAILHVVTGHRRRPLVITADRGRGKSAALGIAAAQIYQSGKKNIVVCAPSKKMAAIIFKHAELINPNCKLNFYSPDELYQQLPEADLIIIDEAAVIPLSMLNTFLTHYSRIVFSSTQHGYEGSGRGFAINFKKTLDKIAPEWKSFTLKAPIRWNDNDSLEAFIFDALLLDAEPVDFKEFDVDTSDPEYLDTTNSSKLLSSTTFTFLDKETLAQDSSKLRQTFGLLVSAHYQTKPSDLMQMLDDKNLSIACLTLNKHVIAVVLICKEGDINEEEYLEGIYNGTRRLNGHLVSQSLSANLGIQHAPQLAGDRILRIAVHPDLQQKGLGTHVLNQVYLHSEADYISSSFGATPALIDFWLQAEYTPVYLGMKRDASSGAHSLIVLKAKSKAGKTLIEKAKTTFNQNFPHWLTDPFKILEPFIVMKLLSSLNDYTIDEKQRRQLNAFAFESRGYENDTGLIYAFVRKYLPSNKVLTDLEIHLLITKVLQNHTWQETIHKLSRTKSYDINGKKAALKQLREAIAKLINGAN